MTQAAVIEDHVPVMIPPSPAAESAADFPLPAAGTVDLWVVRLDEVTRRPEILAEQERARANRFHFEADQERFVAGRTALRMILGRYVGMAPEDVAFGATSGGKPYLDFASPLEFNLSHSGDLMLVAASADGPVGVDVEYMREDLPFQALADEYFPNAEAAQLRLMRGSAVKLYFYHTWTRFEAKLKASGVGLSYGIRGVDLRDWQAVNVKVDTSYAAALAFLRGARQIACRRWAQ